MIYAPYKLSQWETANLLIGFNFKKKINQILDFIICFCSLMNTPRIRNKIMQISNTEDLI